MKQYLLWLGMLIFCSQAFAHPMPSSIVQLSVLENAIRGESRIPSVELGNAVGNSRLAHIHDPFFKTYFTQHIAAVSAGQKWNTQIESIRVITDTDPVIGTYQEVLVQFTLTPPAKKYLRNFIFNYDAVIHQVVTHSALIYVQQDWANGIHEENSAQAIGVIELDVPTGKIFPLRVNLEDGSWWKGFKSMVHLGMNHIAAGTDHLLFLIVLLLPAPLKINNKSWGGFGGARYSVIRLLKIITAFTIGHSVTLLAGALNWVNLPTQPIEILIAISILVSAVHAIKPVFPGKEMFIAAGFGLIHGLAFASTLANLQLDAGRLAISILGFNLGIELMQLFVIILTIPWLLLLSRTNIYKLVKLAGAILAIIAASGWLVERIQEAGNPVTDLVSNVANYAPWLLACLAGFALLSFWFGKRINA